MRKVGIMSMQRIRNYGSFLQAYALKALIENLGCKVQFVDYKAEPCVSGRRKRKCLSIIKRLYRYIKSFSMTGNEKLNYDFSVRYENEFLPLIGVSGRMRYRTKVDTLVIGSDEVFNCLQNNPDVGYSRELFGYRNKADKLITYAASFGNTTVERLEKHGKRGEITELLKGFDYISVRDSNSEHVIETLLHRKPNYNMDPVLMYDFSHLIDEKSVKHTDFIIVYAYSGRITGKEAEDIKKFAEARNKRLISIGGYQSFCAEHLMLTPFEVLAYFRKADCIITDTFHGSIFSIINNKQFVTIIRKSIDETYGNEEKLTDLLNKLQLSNRILTSVERLGEIMNEQIDYIKVNSLIMLQREQTINYLKDNL